MHVEWRGAFWIGGVDEELQQVSKERLLELLDGPAREEQARLFDADLAAVRARLAELAAP